MCVCPLSSCAYSLLWKETSEETRGDKQSPLLFSFCRSLTPSLLCDRLRVLVFLSVCLRLLWGGHDRLVSAAQTAVTETFLNLSLSSASSHPSPPFVFVFFLLAPFPLFSSLPSVSPYLLCSVSFSRAFWCHDSLPLPLLIPSLLVCLWGDDCIRSVWLWIPASHFPHFTG